MFFNQNELTETIISCKEDLSKRNIHFRIYDIEFIDIQVRIVLFANEKNYLI